MELVHGGDENGGELRSRVFAALVRRHASRHQSADELVRDLLDHDASISTRASRDELLPIVLGWLFLQNNT